MTTPADVRCPQCATCGAPIILSTSEFGELLGMTAQFVRGEMKDHRLQADFEITRPGKSKIYKFTPATFVKYCRQFCPRALELPHIQHRLGLPLAS